MHAPHEQDGHQCAADGQQHHQKHRPHVQRGQRHGEAGGRHAEKGRDEIRHRRGHQTGDQSRVVEDAHANDPQCEHGGRQWCAEQGGEHGAHAAQRGQRQVFFAQMQRPAGTVADAAADLQGRALTARRAAQQMGDAGGDEYEGN